MTASILVLYFLIEYIFALLISVLFSTHFYISNSTFLNALKFYSTIPGSDFKIKFAFDMVLGSHLFISLIDIHPKDIA